MWVYIARRVLWLPILLFLVSMVTFGLFRVVPGDPVTVMLGQRYTDERAVRLRETLGLDRPIAVQYGDYMWRVARYGDFGESFRFPGRQVRDLIASKLWVTARLNFAALVVSLGVGLPLGFFIAHKQGQWIDPATVAVAIMFMSIPVMVSLPFLLWGFCLKLHWLPCSGWGGLLDVRIIVPAFGLGVGGIASFARLMRASTLDVMGQDFIRTARSKGLSELTIDYRHTLKNALIPIVTILAFVLAGLLGGSFIVERLLGIPGIGDFVIQAIFNRDYPVVMAITLIASTAMVLSFLLSDIAYAFIDPRIRYR